MDAVFEPELADDEMCVGRVTVFRIINEAGEMRDDVRTDGGSNDAELDVATAVGMLAIAEHTMLCDHGCE